MNDKPKYPYSWPDCEEWYAWAEQVIASREEITFSKRDSKVLAGMGIKV